MEKLMIITTFIKPIVFIGKHRPDLGEKSPNWHYYETESGNILHFRKEHMIAVLETTKGVDVDIT